MRQGRDVQGCALLLAALLGGCDGCHESKTSTLGAGAGGGGGGEPSIPPDPATVATPLDRTVATAVGRDAAFLYSAEDPIQKGVAPGTIDPLRTSVLRGAVTTRDGEPLPGVLVRVLGHSEYGETATRLDGGFDLAVNGGAKVTLTFHKRGFPSAQRAVVARASDFTSVAALAMVALDEPATPVPAGAASGMSVARGSAATDASGTRRATLLFPSGTEAVSRLADGSTEPLPSMSVRATEFTVGENGGAAMPSELPPASAFTYAVELSVDEAIEAGAAGVEFSQPVAFYVENFLGFPVGTPAPAGFYDESAGVWVPSKSGRVIGVVSTSGGEAQIDVDGDGDADPASALEALGISGDERARLATLYSAGDSLWRVPVTHFSKWDINWGFSPPADAVPPSQPPPIDDTLDEPCLVAGYSSIECENQTLREDLPIAGTSFHLHYQSDRVPDRTSQRALAIPLSGASVPESLERIELQVDVAGRTFEQSHLASPDQIATVDWDGQDAYGRLVQGVQPATVRIGYVYRGVYQVTDAFGASGNGVLITGGGTPETRRELTFWQEHATTLGGWDMSAEVLGGWSLNVHHRYDPPSRALHLGGGGRRTVQAIGQVITTFAGSPTAVSTSDGLPATKTKLHSPQGAAFAPEGSVYLAEYTSSRVRRIHPDGTTSTVVGGFGFSGDGGPAGEARIASPVDVAVGPDGSLYIADQGNSRIRQVGPDGGIRTFAGDGGFTHAGDGGLATKASIGTISGVAVGPDGSVYFSSSTHACVRRVGTDGIITTVAGIPGSFGYSGDGGPAREAKLHTPAGLTVGADGTLYLADAGSSVVRAVGPDGMIRAVAGTGGQYGYSGDGGPATQAKLANPLDVAVMPDGSLFIADSSNYAVRHVAPDGTISTFAGGTACLDACPNGDNGPPGLARMGFVDHVVLGPDGSLLIGTPWDGVVRRVASPLPGLSLGEIAVASEGGREMYVFDSRGKHDRTIDTSVGAVRHAFAYDAEGLLVSITSEGGLTTEIERDASGQPAAIVGPFGKKTTLAVDGGGYLARVVNPAGEAIDLTYSKGGLLQSLTDPLGHVYTYEYDAGGRLTKDADAIGGSVSLSRADGARGHEVTIKTALGRTTVHTIERPPGGGSVRTTVGSNGIATTVQAGAAGDRLTTLPDGTVVTSIPGPDPRFGMLALTPGSTIVTTPGALTFTRDVSRSATLADPTDPLSLTSSTEVRTVNGLEFTSSFNAAARKLTGQSPLGRQASATLDKDGRLVTAEAPGLAPILFGYDAEGRISQVKQGPRTTSFAYGPDGTLASVTDPAQQTTSYGRDPVGRVTARTLPDGSTVTYGYDAGGNLTSLKPPGKPAHTFSHTPVGLLGSHTAPNAGQGSNTVSYGYNSDRQPTTVARPDGTLITIGYDSAGRLASIATPGGSYVYSYDAVTGQLAQAAGPGGGVLQHGYDGGLLTDVTLSGAVAGTVHRTYDAFFRVASESVNGGAAITRQYDDDGLLVAAGALGLQRDPGTGWIVGTTAGGVTETFVHDTLGDVVSYLASYQGAPLLALQYTRDGLGRIEAKTETILGEQHTFEYYYDPAGRLVSVIRDGAPYSTHAYDANGNRTSHAGPAGSATGTYDAQDRLTQYGMTAYTFTPNGELEKATEGGATTTYTYDALGILRSAALPGGPLVEYVIDPAGRRAGRRVDGALVQGFLYGNQLGPAAELESSGVVASRFVYATADNVPDLILKGGATYRVLTDHLGSPRLVVNIATGVVAQRMDYDELGRVLLDTSPAFQPFGFGGGIHDAATGLVRFGARDYDPRTGRWTTRDPIGFDGGDTNLYGHVLADPVNGRDSLGLWFWYNPSHWDGGRGKCSMEQQVKIEAAIVTAVTLIAQCKGAPSWARQAWIRAIVSAGYTCKRDAGKCGTTSIYADEPYSRGNYVNISDALAWYGPCDLVETIAHEGVHNALKLSSFALPPGHNTVGSLASVWFWDPAYAWTSYCIERSPIERFRRDACVTCDNPFDP